MEVIDLIALFGVMVVMAVMPSGSVVVVVTRSAAYGFRHGVAASVGIVSGDLVFVILALAGLAAAAEVLGEHLVFLRYLAGIYLIWFGLSLLGSGKRGRFAEPRSGSMLSSYLAGFLLTLGDIKAVFFYASLFPAFVEIDRLGLAEALVMALVVIITVGTVKLGYAYLAHKAVGSRRGAERTGAAVLVAGGVSVGAGIVVLAKA